MTKYILIVIDPIDPIIYFTFLNFGKYWNPLWTKLNVLIKNNYLFFSINIIFIHYFAYVSFFNFIY